MGSSPVTATTPPSTTSASAQLLCELRAVLLAGHAARRPSTPLGIILVAFSGGPDSTALLWGLRQLSRELGFGLAAAHLDHGMDNGSAARARQARQVAADLGIDALVVEVAVPQLRLPGESPETAARRLRYRHLERLRRELGAELIATAHHRDDQAETAVLRLAMGSGLLGLAGIEARHGAVIRPVLGLSRALLAAVLAERGLAAIDDPSNRNFEALRNRCRHRLLPALEREAPGVGEQLARLARLAARARERLAGPLLTQLDGRFETGGLTISRRAFTDLPAPLQAIALGLAHRAARVPYPATQAAQQELCRQLGRRGRVGCDCGHGLRWEASGGRLRLARGRAPAVAFSYTLQVPGEVSLPEIGGSLSLFPAAADEGPRDRQRAASGGPAAANPRAPRAVLFLELAPGETVEVRNRRAGDRVHPAGSGREVRLKEVLADVPHWERDGIPLLLVRGTIAWVAGVTPAKSRPEADQGRWWRVEVAFEPPEGAPVEGKG